MNESATTRSRAWRLLHHPLFSTLLLLLGLLLLAAGYWGVWVWDEPAGLRILGLDLAEYVKFMAEVRTGQISVQREVFYLPLVALSLSLSLLAHRAEFWLPGALRWVLNMLALPAALAMLPPAWTPTLLLTPEFFRQTAAIGICLLAALLSYPLLRHLPRLLTFLLIAALAVTSILLPVAAFSKLQPGLAAIYGGSASQGRGPWLTALGLALLALATSLALAIPPGYSRHHPIQRRRLSAR